jgi:hypothetical protein
MRARSGGDNILLAAGRPIGKPISVRASSSADEKRQQDHNDNDGRHNRFHQRQE